MCATEVLGAIHHAAGPRARRKLPEQPTPAEMRSAVAVAIAIGELIRESQMRAGAAFWAVEVPEDTAELSRRAGTSLEETEDAIALLFAVEVLTRVESPGVAHVRLAEGVFAEEPTLAQLAWEDIRTRLSAVQASLMPPMAVVRELARASRVPELEDGSTWVPMTLARLSERTLFQRTALTTAIAGLEEAALIERGRRRGQQGEYRLLPAAFGYGVPLTARNHLRSQSPPSHTPTPDLPPPRTPLPTDGIASPPVPVPALPGASVPVQIGGVPFQIPPGMPVSIEFDREGHQYVCIGPHVRIGPL